MPLTCLNQVAEWALVTPSTNGTNISHLQEVISKSRPSVDWSLNSNFLMLHSGKKEIGGLPLPAHLFLSYPSWGTKDSLNSTSTRRWFDERQRLHFVHWEEGDRIETVKRSTSSFLVWMHNLRFLPVLQRKSPSDSTTLCLQKRAQPHLTPRNKPQSECSPTFWTVTNQGSILLATKEFT